MPASTQDDPDFNHAYGVLTITQFQPGLKKVHWEVHWVSAEGKEETFQRDLLRPRKLHVLGTIRPTRFQLPTPKRQPKRSKAFRMQKPWYTHLYIKSPIAKLAWGFFAVLASIGLVALSGVRSNQCAWKHRPATGTDAVSKKAPRSWNNNCFTCHGPEGKGGAGPALNSKYFFTQRLNDLSYLWNA